MSPSRSRLDRASFWILVAALVAAFTWLCVLSRRVDGIAKMDPCWERKP